MLVLLNNSGSLTQMELFIVYRRVAELLADAKDVGRQVDVGCLDAIHEPGPNARLPESPDDLAARPGV